MKNPKYNFCKLKKIFFSLLIALFFLGSCFHEIGIKPISTNNSTEENCGSLRINTSSSSRAILISDITNAKITVSGHNISNVEKTVSVSGGKGNFTVENIPVGKNRIVTVEALNGTNNIKSAVMRAVVDITLGDNSTNVTWVTTALGNVFYELLESGYNISDITSTDKTTLNTLVNSARGSSHPLLVNAKSIATDYKASSLKAAFNYKISPATLTFTSANAQSAFSAKISDPSSKIKNPITSGTNAISDIIPGEWNFLISSDTTIVKNESISLTAGQTKNLGAIAFAIPAPSITPATQTFASSQNITMSCNFDGASIYYTLNGSIPNSSSTKYTGQFTISKTSVIRAVAIVNGFAHSDVTTKIYIKTNIPLTEDPSGVMLQGFNWDSAKDTNPDWYTTIFSKASEIKDTFEYVWFPPPSNSGSDEGYLPRELNNLNSKYGTEAQLRAAINSISPAKAIADVVVNHRVGTADWGDFRNPQWDEDYYSICNDDEGFSAPGANMNGSNKGGAPDTGEGYEAARDLDHTNLMVNTGIVNWMVDKLKDAGFVGWRYDFVKGFAGDYVGYYNKMTDSAFSVGELWPTQGFQPSQYGQTNPWKADHINWVNATKNSINGVDGQESRIFDFVLKGNLNYAFGFISGSDESQKNLWNLNLLADDNNIFRSNPNAAVTFVDNHDTGSTQQHWELDPGDLFPAYAFILTHPGYPTVAWQHYFDGIGYQYKAGNTWEVVDMAVKKTNTLRQHIDRLIGIRKSLKIKYNSSITVLSSSNNYYVARITGDSGEIIVRIGEGWDNPTDAGYAGNTPIYYGINFAIWQKGKTGGNLPVPKITFYFRIPSWINEGVELYTDGNGTNWDGVQMEERSNNWYKATVFVDDQNGQITYQPRMKQNGSVKYMKAPEELGADATITAPGGFVVIDAFDDNFDWDGDNFSLKDAGKITTPANDPNY